MNDTAHNRAGPPKAKAAGVRPTPAAALTESPSPEILAQEQDARKFAKLQERAARAGHSLVRVPSGFMLVRATGSHHSECLDTLAAILSGREVAA